MGGPCFLSLNALLIVYLAFAGVRDPGRSVYDAWNSVSETAIRAQRWPSLVASARQGAMLSAGSPGQVAYFHSLACLGEFKLHRYDAALRSGVAARAAAIEGRKWRMLARAENCLMRVYRLLGNLELSYEAGRAMLGALDRDPGSRTIEYRSFFAYVIASMGRRQEAITQLRMVIREADDLPLPPRGGLIFVRALESAKADALEQIGLILLRSGDIPGAEDYLLHAFRIRRLSDPAKLTWSYNSLAELRMSQGRPAEAAALWTKSMADSKAGLEAWFPLYFRARANLALSKPTAALQDMLAALASVRDLRLHLPFGDEIQVESEVSLHRIFSLAVQTAAELGRTDLAFAIAMESRAYSLKIRAAAQSDWRRRLPPRYWNVLASLRSLPGQQPHRAVALRRELAEMESAAGLVSASTDVSATNWRSIARSIRAGDRFTFFFLLDPRSIRWTIEGDRLRFDWLQPQRAIGDAADAFTAAVRQNEPSHRQLGATVFQSIFGGLEPLPVGAVWTILPDEQLFQVPFAALSNPQTGRYLVEEGPLRLVAGVSRVSNSSLGVPSSRLFAAFADPIGNRADSRWNQATRWWSRLGPASVAGPELPRLSGSLAEVERCSRFWRWGASRVLTGRDLLQSDILPPKAAVLHFATHMIPGPSPTASPLIFLGLNDAGNSVSLSETEIEALQLHPGLVTLSGCGSGTGRLAPGVGLLGLTRAWLMAGAKSVLASLWAVPDGSGTLFEAFYRSLQQFDAIDSRSAAIALSQAQAAAIGSSRVSVWSAYFVIGLSMVN